MLPARLIPECDGNGEWLDPTGDRSPSRAGTRRRLAAQVTREVALVEEAPQGASLGCRGCPEGRRILERSRRVKGRQ